MKSRNLILLVLALVVGVVYNAPGATGDIKWATVETNGWVLQVCVASIRTNGGFYWGFGTNNTGPSRVVVGLTRQGFNDAGALTTLSRTVYGTKELRWPFPNYTNNDVLASGSDVVARVALSDYVFGSDSNLTCTIAANWYSNNAANAAVTITNLSILDHPKPIANWSWPGWERVTGNAMTLRAVGFHRSGQQGRPLRAMQFVAQGATSGLWLTNWATLSRTYESAADTWICEYVGTIDISTLTAQENVRCDFTAYPWEGTNTLTTFDNANTGFSPLYRSITNLCDRTLAYAGPYGCWAIVATNGSDATGIACTNAPMLTNGFATINGALLAIKGTNNAMFGHNDVGGGVVYLTEGNHVWTGGSGAYNTVPKTWLTVTRWSSNTIGQVAIASQSGNKYVCKRDKVEGLTLSSTAAAGNFSGGEVLWAKDCIVNSGSGVLFYQTTANYFTGNTVSNLAGYFPPYSVADNNTTALLRGNLLRAAPRTLFYTMIGNRRDITNTMGTTSFAINELNGQVAPKPTGAIFAFNVAHGLYGSGAAVQFNQYTNVVGLAMVQNVLEAPFTMADSLLRLAGDNTTSTNSNVLLWCNTLIGGRANTAYNDFTNNIVTMWSVRGNALDDANIKTDTFNYTTTGYGPREYRTNNWTEVWGVGWSGNALGNLGAIGANGFSHVGVGSGTNQAGGFTGLSSWETETPPPTGYYQYADRHAWDGTNNGTGLGTYRLQSASPLTQWAGEWALPYDIEGNARGNFDPPGAYASGNPRKGGGFFGL